MKKHFSFILLTIILLNNRTLSAQIIINGKSSDDGSLTLTKGDSLYIHPFSIKNVGKLIEKNSKKEIYFELINSEQLKQICAQNKYTWVFIQSSWCGACSVVLKKYVKIADSLKSAGVNLVVINQDIHIKNLKKKISIENYYVLSYIIDPKQYGTIETKKQEQFIKEISRNTIIKDYSSYSVP